MLSVMTCASIAPWRPITRTRSLRSVELCLTARTMASAAAPPMSKRDSDVRQHWGDARASRSTSGLHSPRLSPLMVNCSTWTWSAHSSGATLSSISAFVHTSFTVGARSRLSDNSSAEYTRTSAGTNMDNHLQSSPAASCSKGSDDIEPPLSTPSKSPGRACTARSARSTASRPCRSRATHAARSFANSFRSSANASFAAFALASAASRSARSSASAARSVAIVSPPPSLTDAPAAPAPPPAPPPADAPRPDDRRRRITDDRRTPHNTYVAQSSSVRRPASSPRPQRRRRLQSAQRRSHPAPRTPLRRPSRAVTAAMPSSGL
mmetsp:Transcript_3244/g.11737  ORF Transcript_3244/g.11737 Transcript_3244/m.11737 type:complete len:322 (-) Transcript_3244:883-1848(-)